MSNELQNKDGDELRGLAASYLLDPEKRSQAREICFECLNNNPGDTRTRLLLARSFYLDSFNNLALRELYEIAQNITTPSLERLIVMMGGTVPSLAKAMVEPWLEKGGDGAVVEKKAAGDAKVEVEPSLPEGEMVEADEGQVLGELDLEDEFLAMYEEVTNANKSNGDQ